MTNSRQINGLSSPHGVGGIFLGVLIARKRPVVEFFKVYRFAPFFLWAKRSAAPARRRGEPSATNSSGCKRASASALLLASPGGSLHSRKRGPSMLGRAQTVITERLGSRLAPDQATRTTTCRLIDRPRGEATPRQAAGAGGGWAVSVRDRSAMAKRVVQPRAASRNWRFFSQGTESGGLPGFSDFWPSSRKGGAVV